MKKKAFTIGQLVHVNLNNRVEAAYNEKGYREIKRKKDLLGVNDHTNELWLARITGVKFFQEGTYHPGSTSHSPYFEGDSDPPYLIPKSSIKTWAVRLGYRNKELYFFEEDIVNNIEGVLSKGEVVSLSSLDIPYFWSGWTDEYREKMSKESASWPRDESGKWKSN